MQYPPKPTGSSPPPWPTPGSGCANGKSQRWEFGPSDPSSPRKTKPTWNSARPFAPAITCACGEWRWSPGPGTDAARPMRVGGTEEIPLLSRKLGLRRQVAFVDILVQSRPVPLKAQAGEKKIRHGEKGNQRETRYHRGTGSIHAPGSHRIERNTRQAIQPVSSAISDRSNPRSWTKHNCSKARAPNRKRMAVQGKAHQPGSPPTAMHCSPSARGCWSPAAPSLFRTGC